jgi:acyl-CoA synthetase (AMP-forming)/AMP-acid ligase II
MQYDTNYGLTEASGPGCVHLGIENEHKVGSIGQAGFGWETRIVDDNGIDVVENNVGELIVKGCGVMKEYYMNAEKTADTVKEDWLYTGDMAKEDEQGFIYLVDRKKDIIITGGENIYPVEIEDVLHSHHKIYDAAVIGFPDDRLGEIVLAVVELKPGETMTEAEILTYCDENLAKYKRPRRLVFDKIPRSPTGKIEKPSLRHKYCES